MSSFPVSFEHNKKRFKQIGSAVLKLWNYQKIQGSIFKEYRLSTAFSKLITYFLKFFNIISDIVYHGTQSSTSSELSPVVEQKSLPRRGRPRYLSENAIYNFSTNTTPRHKACQSIINKSPSRPTKMQSSINEISFLEKNSKFRPISTTLKQTLTFEK